MLQVVTAPTSTPAGLLTATYRPRLSGAVAGDDDRILEIIEDLTQEGERLSPGRWVYAVYKEQIVLDNLQTMLYLQARPVASVTSVAFGTATALDAGTDATEYAIWPGQGLYRENGWDTGEPGWAVTYAGGYWLPSMGAAPGSPVADIDVEGVHLRRALWVSLQATWAEDRDPDSRVKSVNIAGAVAVTTATRNDSGRLVLPPASAAIFLSEGAPRV